MIPYLHSQSNLDALIATTRPRFADPDTQYAYQIGQDTPRLSDGSKLLLLECPMCGLAWIRQGRDQVLLHPSEDQVFALAAWLKVEVDAQTHTWRLPRHMCPDCCTLRSGGLFSAEEYPTLSPLKMSETNVSAGFRFTWHDQERHLICMIARYRALDSLLRTEPDLLLGSRTQASCVLDWLGKMLANPVGMFDLNQRECHLLTERFTPHPTQKAVHVWRAFASLCDCPPLGGCQTLMILAEARTLESQWEPEDTLLNWQRAAERILQSEVWWHA